MCAFSGAIIVPGLPGMLKSNGLSIWELEMYFALAMLVCLVPSGMAATKFGEKSILVLAGVLLILGASTYVVAQSFVGFLAAEVLLGTGLGCLFGTDESLLHRSLSESSESNRFGRIWDFVTTAQICAAASAFVLGGWLSELHERLPFAAAACGYSMLLLRFPGNRRT